MQDIPYYKMLCYDDCVRTSICNILHIPPRKLPSFIKQYNEYEKNGGKLHWIKFFSKMYKPYGFRLYVTDDARGFSIGICAPLCYKSHAIICLDYKPYFNPDRNIYRAQYQPHQVKFFIKIYKMKNFNKIWNKK